METDQNEKVGTAKAEEKTSDKISGTDKPVQKQENLQSANKIPLSGNDSSTRKDAPPGPDADSTTQNGNVAATAKTAARKQKIILILTAAVCLIILIYLLTNTAMCDTSPSMKGIEVVEEKLVTDAVYTIIGESLYPILLVKVKNNSSSTKKVSFEANFYADGQLLGNDQANYVTLEPGDEAILQAQSDKGYKFWTQHEYSYKITKWWIYTP